MAWKLSLRRSTLAIAGCAILAATAVEAAPLSLAPSPAVGLSSTPDGALTEQVAYRRRYGRVYRRGYNPGAAIAAGAALGLVGAGIAAATAPRYDYYPAYGYGYAPYGGYGYGGYRRGYYGY